ncbi:MAG: hypothetical protein EOP84_35425 [Verrucomicrobiaceae bacterium]|nr:MAG: hypothetical protein EOP84_35425 [Verrucomicrobiaceae bacterium]
MDGAFQGAALSIGGATPVSLWTYRLNEKPVSLPGKLHVSTALWTPLEVVAEGRRLRVILNGQEAFNMDNTPGVPRSVLAFHVLGEGAELRVRQPKLELLKK